MSQHIKIPQDRIGVIIGEGGETKREIEESAEVSLTVDSDSGSVRIDKTGDPIKGLKGSD
ncbi:MAG: KH domain-containing protein, partial [Halobacteria archaeon]|nr:KH domain-containing protein [Halobacteria archaeon]